MNEAQLYGQMRHAIPLLRQLLPGHGSLDIELIIGETARAMRMRPCNTWQEAWNLATGATPARPGRFQFWAHITCPTCHGSRIDRRRNAGCVACMTRGRQHVQISQVALYAPTPEPVGGPSL